MNGVLHALFTFLGRPRLVEFDYRDTQGLHHGRCYVSCLFGGGEQVKRMMSSLGYRNVHIS